MKGNSSQLLRVAEALAAGTEIDWQQALARAMNQEERKRIVGLKWVALVERAHSSWDEGLSVLGGERSRLPRRWGNLELLERLGSGAFGEVYRALDPQLNREIAVKLLRVRHGSGSSDRAVHEGRLLARIKHTNVASVFGAESHEGRPGILMELIRGRTLEAIVRDDGRKSAREAALIGIDVCRALAAVHGCGIVHRDVKAQNVMREAGGRIVLMDLGVGSEARSFESPRQPPAGTPLYMAPEILAGEEATFVSDVYSLGVLLFFLVSSSYPVEGRELLEIREAHSCTGSRHKRQSLRDLRTDLDLDFIHVVEKATEALPDRRFRSCAELERELNLLVRRSASSLKESDGRRWRSLLMATIVLIALAVSVVWLREASPRLRAEALYAEAMEKRSQSGPDEAIPLLLAALEVWPEFVAAHTALADCYEGNGNYSEALASATRAKRLCCEGLSKLEGHLVLGGYYSTTMQLEAAREEFELATVLGGVDEAPEAWRRLAEVLAISGRSDHALDAFATALELDPNHVVARGFKAVVHSVLMQPDEALKEVEIARRIHSGNAATPSLAYLNWGEGLAYLVRDAPEKEDRRRALEAFERLVEGGPALVSYGRLLKAQWLMVSGRLNEAIRELEEGLPLDRSEGMKNIMLLRFLRSAQVHAVQGDSASAAYRLTLLERALGVAPNFLESLREVGLLYVELGDAPSAHRILEKLKTIRFTYESNLSIASVLHLEGALALSEGDGLGAEKKFDEACSFWDDPLLSLSRAQMYLDLERVESAEAEVAKLLTAKGRILQWHSAVLWLSAERLALELQELRGGGND